MSSTVIFADPASELVTLTNTSTCKLVATDPTTVTLTVTDPLNNPVSYTYGGAGTITRTGTGAYTSDIARHHRRPVAVRVDRHRRLHPKWTSARGPSPRPPSPACTPPSPN